jgi:hypothetical protein
MQPVTTTRLALAFLVAACGLSASGQPTSAKSIVVSQQTKSPTIELAATKKKRKKLFWTTHLRLFWNCTDPTKYVILTNMEPNPDDVISSWGNPSCRNKGVGWNIPWCRNHDDFRNEHFIKVAMWMNDVQGYKIWVIYQSNESDGDWVRYRDQYGWYPKARKIPGCARVGGDRTIVFDQSYDPPFYMKCD